MKVICQTLNRWKPGTLFLEYKAGLKPHVSRGLPLSSGSLSFYFKDMNNVIRGDDFSEQLVSTYGLKPQSMQSSQFW